MICKDDWHRFQKLKERPVIKGKDTTTRAGKIFRCRVVGIERGDTEQSNGENGRTEESSERSKEEERLTE